MDRCHEETKNREGVLRSHKDVNSKRSRLVAGETKLEVALHMQKLVRSFEATTQVQVSWDESHYDSSAMVIAAWDHKKKIAGFLPIQQMAPVYIEELDEAVQALCCQGTRALSHSLASIGLPLESFILGEELIARPLEADERRIFSDGVPWIYNLKSSQVVRQIPAGMALDQVPVLISVSDQGPLNVPALDMLVYHLKLSMNNQWDCYHRCWRLR